MGKFEIYKSANGYRWRLKAKNGEIIASSQAYAAKNGAIKGCEAVGRAARDADIFEIE